MGATVQMCPRCSGNIEERKKSSQPRRRLAQEKGGQLLEPKLLCLKERGTFQNGDWGGFVFPWGDRG